MYQKGLKEYLEEDPSLTKELIYKEFQNSIVSCDDLDNGIEAAYDSYKKAKTNNSSIW